MSKRESQPVNIESRGMSVTSFVAISVEQASRLEIRPQVVLNFLPRREDNLLSFGYIENRKKRGLCRVKACFCLPIFSQDL